jgi:hypothetical protein
MNQNRIRHLSPRDVANKRSAQVPEANSGFVMLPPSLFSPWQQAIYQAAYERAQAAMAEQARRKEVTFSLN